MMFAVGVVMQLNTSVLSSVFVGIICGLLHAALKGIAWEVLFLIGGVSWSVLNRRTLLTDLSQAPRAPVS